MPEMIFVNSSHIEAIGYDGKNQDLYVRFLKSGRTYIYSPVEEWVFEEFKAADSQGVYFNTNIKNGYSYRE